MSLHPQIRFLLDAIQENGIAEGWRQGAVHFREVNRAPMPEVREPVARVEERTISGEDRTTGLRIYTPDGPGPFPLMMFFHGGGFVTCDLDSHDPVCRRLCNLTGAVIVAVDYALAPEHPFPAAPEDCYQATCYAVEMAASLNADPDRLIVVGDSAGGNLASVVCLLSRERGGPTIRHQVLYYPATSHRCDTPSWTEFATGYFLTKPMMQWFWQQYLQNPEDGESPLASPLLTPDPSGLPPATIFTAGLDPLRDEGLAWAKALERAGVPATARDFPGLIHGFLNFAVLVEPADVALRESAAMIRAIL